MHKQSTKGRRKQRNLKNNFFSYNRQADMLLFKDSLLGQQVRKFFFFFLLFQKIGSVGRWETKHLIGMALALNNGKDFSVRE